MWKLRQMIQRDPLERAVHMIAIAQLDLEVKGYPPGLVSKSIERARGTAEWKTQSVSLSIREQAFYDTLQTELSGCEHWCRRALMFARGELDDDD